FDAGELYAEGVARPDHPLPALLARDPGLRPALARDLRADDRGHARDPRGAARGRTQDLRHHQLLVGEVGNDAARVAVPVEIRRGGRFRPRAPGETRPAPVPAVLRAVRLRAGAVRLHRRQRAERDLGADLRDDGAAFY